MVLTWQKPKYAPFEEQAEHELGASTLVLIEAEGETPAEDPADPSSLGDSPNSFEVDLLDGWLKA